MANAMREAMSSSVQIEESREGRHHLCHPMTKVMTPDLGRVTTCVIL